MWFALGVPVVIALIWFVAIGGAYFMSKDPFLF